MVELRADEIFSCLERHGVRYVVIRGLAGILRPGTVEGVDGGSISMLAVPVGGVAA